MKSHIIAQKCFPLLLALVCIGGLLVSPIYPGLYADAVYPDYKAVHVINPSEYSIRIDPSPDLGIPLLGQLYHGTITMFCSIISILITGGTSVLQLRILNSIYGFIACLTLWMIFRKLKVSDYIAAIVVLILAISPNLTSMYKTQFYIMLPGVDLLLLSILFTLRWRENNSNRDIIISGVLLGLSFYDYFSFGFCIPGMVIALIFIGKSLKRNIRKVLLFSLIGVVAGCIPYFIGYEFVLLDKLLLTSKAKIAISLLSIVLIIGVLGLFYYLQKENAISSKQKKASIALSVCCLVIICFFCIRVYQSVSNTLASLNVAGRNADIVERISLLKSSTVNILDHSAFEYLVMIKYIDSDLFLIPVVTLVLSMCSLLYVYIKRRFTIRSKTILYSLIGMFFYYVLSIPFASRMQSQHFVIMLFMFYLLLGLSMHEFIEILCDINNSTKVRALGKSIVSIILCVFITICIFTQNKINMEMKDDRNVNNIYYTEAIEKLSQNAMMNHEKSIDEYYIFPEWGVMFGFDYLTCNMIPYSVFFDNNNITTFTEKGYRIVVCYFDQNNTAEYKSQLTHILGSDRKYGTEVIQCWGGDLYILTCV